MTTIRLLKEESGESRPPSLQLLDRELGLVRIWVLVRATGDKDSPTTRVGANCTVRTPPRVPVVAPVPSGLGGCELAQSPANDEMDEPWPWLGPRQQPVGSLTHSWNPGVLPWIPGPLEP